MFFTTDLIESTIQTSFQQFARQLGYSPNINRAVDAMLDMKEKNEELKQKLTVSEKRAVCCEDFVCIGGLMDLCKECFVAGCAQCRKEVQCPMKKKTIE